VKEIVTLETAISRVPNLRSTPHYDPALKRIQAIEVEELEIKGRVGSFRI
jgi:hypothetical protein